MIFDFFKKNKSPEVQSEKMSEKKTIRNSSSNTDEKNFNSTKWKKPTKRSKAIDIMKANADLAMDEVLPLIAEAINGSINEARAYYKWLCENNYAPGKVSANISRKTKNSQNNNNQGKSLINVANTWLVENGIDQDPTEDKNSLIAAFDVQSSGDTETTVQISVDEDISIVSFIMTPKLYVEEDEISAARKFVEENNPSSGLFEIRDDGLIFYIHSKCFDGMNVDVKDLNDMYSKMFSFFDKIIIDLIKYTDLGRNLKQIDLGESKIQKIANMGELFMSTDHAASVNQCLLKLFDRMMLTYKIDDDGDYYISEGLAFPGWVSVIQDGRFIKIWTWIQFRDGESVDEEAANELVNKINLRFLPNSVYQGNGSLHSQYYYPSETEFDDKQFFSILKRCFESFVASVRECDEDDLVP